MIKTATLIMILALRLFYQPTKAQQGIAPFASQPPAHAVSAHIAPVKIIRLAGSVRNNKAQLEWSVVNNETASMFEVERSTDGLKYQLAAIVFGTDMPEQALYRFHEKARHKKTMYRIKLVNKDKSAFYSPVIEINRGA